ncbi:MAG: hypothetical protein KGJ23_09475 [Euryarchaeota archaeon]|nr:hypothetical protein [Euryarchaeota archaeon]MDE1836832.1 hypothetical protein [Euryarchaeota archaeon]MDE1882041.1 hypothetical protein [Euryarchaeota archaeon]MDE2044816.1 hypothetical protein [Thermoplasmata archaeon]
MEKLPSPYDQDVRLDPGEKFIACWRGVPVRLSENGEIDDSIWYYGRVRRIDPDTSHGLLVLTSWNLRHYLADLSGGPFGGIREEGADDVTIPHRDVLKMDILQPPGESRRLLRVRMRGEALSDGSVAPTEEGESPAEYLFLLDDREDPTVVLAEIRSVSGLVAEEISEEEEREGDEGSGESPEKPPKDDSPIRFHAEQEPD